MCIILRNVSNNSVIITKIFGSLEILERHCCIIYNIDCDDDPNGAFDGLFMRRKCSDNLCNLDWFMDSCKKTCGQCVSGKDNLDLIGMNSC